jgi:hypothetical protein
LESDFGFGRKGRRDERDDSVPAARQTKVGGPAGKLKLKGREEKKGKGRQGKARQGKARQGKARQGKAVRKRGGRRRLTSAVRRRQSAVSTRRKEAMDDRDVCCRTGAT